MKRYCQLANWLFGFDQICYVEKGFDLVKQFNMAY